MTNLPSFKQPFILSIHLLLGQKLQNLMVRLSKKHTHTEFIIYSQALIMELVLVEGITCLIKIYKKV